MSTWTSKVLWPLLLVGLAACQPVAGLSTLGGPAPTITVLDGQFVVRGPSQFCPDASTLKETGDAAAVLLGRCTQEADAPAAVLSVTVGAANSGSVMLAGGAELSGLFTSQAGRAMLSARGRAADIEVLRALEWNGALFLLLSDRGRPAYWRGVTDVSGRLVSVALRGEDLSTEQAFELVETAVKSVKRANSGI